MADVPTTTRLQGTLIRIREQGYGFIHVPHGTEHFVNVNQMRDRSAWVEGTEVRFTPGKAKPGKAPPAYDVVAVKTLASVSVAS